MEKTTTLISRENAEPLANGKGWFARLLGHFGYRNEVVMSDRRTGYYVAGRDWPAISNDIPLEDIYKALNGIDDEAVGAAMDSLREVEVPPEASQEPARA
jgi:hypothetical protein